MRGPSLKASAPVICYDLVEAHLSAPVCVAGSD